MFYVCSLRLNTVPTPWEPQSGQLKPSFNNSGENSFSAPEERRQAAKAAPKTASPRHGNPYVCFFFVLCGRSRRSVRRGFRVQDVLAPVRRPSLQPLSAGTALHARSRSGLAGQAWLRSVVPLDTIQRPLTLRPPGRLKTDFLKPQAACAASRCARPWRLPNDRFLSRPSP